MGWQFAERAVKAGDAGLAISIDLVGALVVDKGPSRVSDDKGLRVSGAFTVTRPSSVSKSGAGPFPRDSRDRRARDTDGREREDCICVRVVPPRGVSAND